MIYLLLKSKIIIKYFNKSHLFSWIVIFSLLFYILVNIIKEYILDLYRKNVDDKINK